jgi:hypothetical protein
MSDQDQWGKNNDAYLSAALEWVRLRLIKLAPEQRSAEATPGGFLPKMFGGKPATPAPSPSAAAAPSDSDLVKARQTLDKCAQADPPPAAQLLQKRFDLSDFELEILLLCASVELDPRIAGLCARAHNDPNKAFPTYALALALFPSKSWDALSPERALRFWRLIEIAQTPAVPLTASPLRADERIVNYLKGLNHLDERLTTLLTLLSAPGQKQLVPLAPSHAAIAETLAHGLTSRTTPGLIHLLGADSSSKQQIASEVADQISTALYLLPASVLPASPMEIETLARAWRRETLLLPVSLYLDAKDAERDAPSVTRFLSRSDGLVFLDTRDNWRNLQRESLTVEVEKPARTEQLASWNMLLNDPAAAAALASQFSLGQQEIYRAAARGTGPGVEDRLWEECRTVSRPKLDLLAQRLDAKATWDDFVLPASETNALQEICIHARQRVQVYDVWGFGDRMNRGMGLSALFAGESGTGKTMAAEVIANELKLNLYRIDLSAVVSKYIGETEKNLRQVFDAAEDGASILFFDEADALFGKRSEVKDSHDRYANIEINYLLQRMESYSGLAILATNLKGSLDTAFLRRLRFIVQFPFPNVAERKRIWERAFPASMPKSSLDLDFLSRLNVAGGTIHNIALKAAFLAAGKRSAVSMDLVLEAARSEFRKLERPVNESEFRWQAKPVTQAAGATA